MGRAARGLWRSGLRRSGDVLKSVAWWTHHSRDPGNGANSWTVANTRSGRSSAFNSTVLCCLESGGMRRQECRCAAHVLFWCRAAHASRRLVQKGAHFKQASRMFRCIWLTSHATWERYTCKVARSARQLQNIKGDKRRGNRRREKVARTYLDKVVLMLLTKNGVSPVIPPPRGPQMQQTCNAGRGKKAFSNP